MSFDESFDNGRGQHGHHRKTSEETKELIRNRIKSFPARESHYSRAKNKRSLFRGKYPNDEIKDWLYHDIFHYEFIISFGSPRTDLCDTCESFQKKIKRGRSNWK